MRTSTFLCAAAKKALKKSTLAPGYGLVSDRILSEDVDHFARFNPSPLSLKTMVDNGAQNACEKTSYLFLRKELPVRLANIMKEINLLPEQLLQTPSVQLVQSWYIQSFQEILRFEKASSENRDTLEEFVETIAHIRNRHANVVETMAHGVIEMRESVHRETKEIEQQIQYFLDRFYMSRISIRMLINQHTLLFGHNLTNHPRHIGCIDPNCKVEDVALDAFENARFLCEQYYMVSPELDVECINPFEEIDMITMCYVPSHLYHMLFELLKNALRAVVEFHGDTCDSLPPIKLTICKGREDVTIKITDQGGGIPRSIIHLLFNYMYSTAPRPPSPQAASTTPLAGYGYGLPLSRLYAKYFNGDLFLSSVEGYGTDAIVQLKVFPGEASELLPVFNKTSYHKYSQSTPVGDWSDSTMTTGLHGAVHTFGGGSSHRQLHTKAAAKRHNSGRRHFGTYSMVSPRWASIKDNMALRLDSNEATESSI